MFINMKTNLPYCAHENSIVRSIDRFLSRLRLRDKLRAKSSPFFPPSIDFLFRDPLQIHQALLPRGIGIEHIGRSISDKYGINPQTPLMASGETRISWSCKVPAVHYVPASSHPLSLFTYVSFFALISC